MVSVNTTWQFTPIGQGKTTTNMSYSTYNLYLGEETQNSSTTSYPVACSLYVLHHEAILDVEQDILWSTMGDLDEPSQRWSLWSPQTLASNNTNLEVLNTGV